jgi:hypothetical protein
MRYPATTRLLSSVFILAVTGTACSSSKGGAPVPGTGGSGGSTTGGSSGSGGSGGTSGSGGTATDGGARPATDGAAATSPDGGGTTPGTDGGTTPGTDAGTPAPGTPIPADDETFLTKPVPVIWLTVNGQAVAPRAQLRAVRTKGAIKVIQDHDGTPVTSIDGKTLALDSPALIWRRGSSSFSYYDQKPFSVELNDATGGKNYHELLGMPAQDDWAIVSCFSDKSCLRNALTYSISRDMAFPAGRWAPRLRFAEVYLDGDYQGLYQVVEKPKGGMNRLTGIPKTGADASAGFLVSANGDARSLGFDRGPLDMKWEFLDDLGLSMPAMTGNRRWKLRTPTKGNVTDGQRMSIQTSLNGFETMLANKTAGWRDKLDSASWIDFYLVNEFTNNADALFKSWYIARQPDSMGGKWVTGPPWDFDIAYGNINYYFRQCTSTSVLGGHTKNVPAMASQPDVPPPPFAQTMLADPAFRNDMQCRWRDLRAPGKTLDPAVLEARIDKFVAHIKVAKARDQAKWKNIPLWVWPNNYVGGSWDDEVKYLKYWIRRRLTWLDANLGGECASKPAPPAVTQTTAPASVSVDRSKEVYGGEHALHFSDYVPIDNSPATPVVPPEWTCPP